MTIGAVISTGFIMGLSASLVCLGWCVPVIMPYTATAERPGAMSGLLTTGLFSMGRLLSYLVLMTIFLALRALVPLSPILGNVASIISGILLILSGLAAAGAIKWRSGFGALLCGRIAGAKSPLYLGVLTGLRPCGPLLAAMAFMLALPSSISIGAFMVSFWFASSLLVIVLGIVGGGLSMLISKRLGLDRLRSITGMAMIFIGFFLVLVSIGGLSAGAI